MNRRNFLLVIGNSITYFLLSQPVNANPIFHDRVDTLVNFVLNEKRSDSVTYQRRTHYTAEEFRAVLETENFRYGISLLRRSTGTTLSIHMTPLHSSAPLATFSDYDLDGNCDFGLIHVKEIDRRGNFPYIPHEGIGLENRMVFENAYKVAVDDLLKFYGP